MTTLNCLRPNCRHQWTNNGEPPQCCPKCRNYNCDQVEKPFGNQLGGKWLDGAMAGVPEPQKKGHWRSSYVESKQ